MVRAVHLLLGLLVQHGGALQAPLRSKQQPASHRAASRRVALATTLVPLLLSPLAASAEDGSALGATCLGFGCNSYQNTDFNGMPAQRAPAGSMPYDQFLKAVKDGKVEGVVFMPPSGDEAYALIEGKSVRMGEGWPVEVSNSWSSPSWVVRILENEGVPYSWNFDLKAKGSYKAKLAQRKQGGYAAEPFIPSNNRVSALVRRGLPNVPPTHDTWPQGLDPSDCVPRAHLSLPSIDSRAPP